MNKINVSFISMSRKSKYFLVSALTIILVLALTYIYVYEIIDVVNRENIFDHLVRFNVSHSNDICPLNLVNDTYSTHYHSSSSWPEETETWAKKLDIRFGEWYPRRCVSQFLVAIIVPYRARESHLKVFAYSIHPFLQKQNIHYKLYVIEQSNAKEFNRGKLFNVGFIEALVDKPFPCFIFHDVDLLPENLNNIYVCTETPRHMSAAIDKYQYRLPYYRNFGGVLSILTDQFKLVNGFSNSFYGWGGEDDDFYNRIRSIRLRPVRFDSIISQYYSLHHEPAEPNAHRFRTMETISKEYNKDGLTSTKYSVIRRSDEPLFTRIIVEL